MSQLENVSVDKRANVHFDGKCVSHSLTMEDGSKKSVGVMLPAQLIFNTAAPEVMEIVAGECRVKLQGSDEWQTVIGGQEFQVSGDSSFEIEVIETLHYVCHLA